MMSEQEIKSQIARFRWYHTIEVAPGVCTESVVPHFKEMWNFNLECIKDVSFQDKRVLDIGCRDGLFSFYAERQGAEEIVGIDNDLSPGAVEWLIPHFDSKVRIEEHNLYYLPESYHGRFDIVICFGVLYHLRYPFWGLKRMLECLKDGGLLLLETGMLAEPALDRQELLYCPVENSPYAEPTSCTFFNQLGLETTLRSLRCRVERVDTLWPFGQTPPQERQGRAKHWHQLKAALRGLLRPEAEGPAAAPLPVCRALLQCRKDESIGAEEVQVTPMGEFDREWKETYWEKTHREHSRKSESA